MAFESTSESERQHDPAEASGARWVFLVAIAVFASLGFLMVYSRLWGPDEQMGGDHPGVGRPLRVVKFEPFIDADRTITTSDLKGHVTLINYWGPWCPPCRIEMPHMVEIEQKYRACGEFQFVSVACGTWVYENLDEMRSETAKYRDQAKLGFPIYFDPDFTSRNGLESDIGREPRSTVYPTTVLVNQQGAIAGMWEGFTRDVPEHIAASIERLITPP